MCRVPCAVTAGRPVGRQKWSASQQYACIRPVLLAAAVERKNPVHAKVCLKVQGPGFYGGEICGGVGNLKKRGEGGLPGEEPKEEA